MSSEMRVLPLYDEERHPSTWNERMVPGEFAVHAAPGRGPECTVFASLAAAESYAQEQIAQHPELRCRIFDHHGFIGKPVQEFAGPRYVGEPTMSHRFRRWTGSILLIGGVALIALDWINDFSLSLPAMLGTRMAPAGLLLLLIELFVVIHERQKKTPLMNGRPTV